MHWREILSRLSGFSTPVFGVSFQPVQAERTFARQLLTFLEDRRVLFQPLAMEALRECVRSVLDIRGFLTQTLLELDKEQLSSSALAQNLKGMRAACRDFLDCVRVPDDYDFRRWQEGANFSRALGELRAAFGLRLGLLAVQNGLDVGGDLEQLLPSEPDDDLADAQQRERIRRGIRVPHSAESWDLAIKEREQAHREARETLELKQEREIACQ